MNTLFGSVRFALLSLVLLASTHWTGAPADEGSAGPVWIDVRSVEEYQESHISGDTRITHTDIVPEVMTLFPDKDTPIYLYCRSGRRAGIAKQALEEAGYVNVINAGGIDDARQARDLK